MKLDEHSVVNPRRTWSAPPDRPIRVASARPPELALPDYGAGMARARTTRKSASRWQALTRLGEERLRREGVVFKQIPYDVKRR